MSNYIMGRCITEVDYVDTSHIQGFSCKPEKGDLVEVLVSGKPTNLEVCSVTHQWEKTHQGHVPIVVVELTTRRNIL